MELQPITPIGGLEDRGVRAASGSNTLRVAQGRVRTNHRKDCIFRVERQEMHRPAAVSMRMDNRHPNNSCEYLPRSTHGCLLPRFSSLCRPHLPSPPLDSRLDPSLRHRRFGTAQEVSTSPTSTLHPSQDLLTGLHSRINKASKH